MWVLKDRRDLKVLPALTVLKALKVKSVLKDCRAKPVHRDRLV